MWPSFSLWAWRILKMRSCLRRPEVPAMSKPRASFVSSAILCSLSSEIVIDLPGFRGGIWNLGGGLPGGSATPNLLEKGSRGATKQLLNATDYTDAEGVAAVGWSF